MRSPSVEDGLTARFADGVVDRAAEHDDPVRRRQVRRRLGKAVLQRRDQQLADGVRRQPLHEKMTAPAPTARPIAPDDRPNDRTPSERGDQKQSRSARANIQKIFDATKNKTRSLDAFNTRQQTEACGKAPLCLPCAVLHEEAR